jgi:dihydropteroate synthase
MGIVNVTPDSFSDGGRFVRHRDAIAYALELVEEGADIVDVGGESTRPGAQPVDEATELARVLPVIEALAPHVRVSVDTMKPAVAAAAVAAGASLVNDVTATLGSVAADCGAGWVAMHLQGEPRTMQHDPTYDDVVSEVTDHLVARADAARAAGVEEVWIDPGIGFGKTFDHNWALLGALPELCGHGYPVAVGTSRKLFLGTALAAADGRAPEAGPTPTDDRLEGSAATAVLAARSGVGMVRVHDVAATVAALGAAGSDEDADRSAGAGHDDREAQRWP